MPKQKCTRQIWIHLVEYPSSKVSDPCEVPRFVGKLIFFLFQEVKLNPRELDNIVLSCTSGRLVRNIVFSNFLHKSIQQTRFTLVLRVRLTKNRFELKGPILCLKPPGNRCTLGLRWHFCCRGRISNPRPVLESPA